MRIRGDKQLSDLNWRLRPSDEKTPTKLKQLESLRESARLAQTGTSKQKGLKYNTVVWFFSPVYGQVPPAQRIKYLWHLLWWQEIKVS